MLSRLDASGCVQTQTLDFRFPDLVLLDFPRHSHGKSFHKLDILRYLKVRDLSLAKTLHVLSSLITARSPVCNQPSASMARAVASGSVSYPFITRYPRVQSSPCWPAGASILTSVSGIAAPTVETRTSIGSSTEHMVITGE